MDDENFPLFGSQEKQNIERSSQEFCNNDGYISELCQVSEDNERIMLDMDKEELLFVSDTSQDSYEEYHMFGSQNSEKDYLDNNEYFGFQTKTVENHMYETYLQELIDENEIFFSDDDGSDINIF